MLKINKIKEEKNVNDVGAILIAHKPQRNTVGANANVYPITKKCNIGVGADASVRPSTKKYPNNRRGTGYRAQEPAAITLVALIITIIILIILAGVSLNLALGQNGIFTKSKQAVDKYKDEAQKEQNTLENIYQDMQAETDGDDDGEDYSKLSIGDYVNYPVKYDNVNTYEVGASQISQSQAYCASNKYANKWRIISIDEQNNTVKLISAGIPLSYYKKWESDENRVIEDLTKKFTEIEISKKSPNGYQFFESGFKNEQNEAQTDMKEIFNNELTNMNEGKVPDVRSAVFEDFSSLDLEKRNVDGYDSYYVKDELKPEDLIFVPCDSSKYAIVWLGRFPDGDHDYWDVAVTCSEGYVGSYNARVTGVRPVVTLKANVKFTPANSDTNETTTWDIAAPANP